jgi:signal transduction histidine kinase
MKLRLLPTTLYGRLVLMLFMAFIGVQIAIALVIMTRLPERIREEMVANDLVLRINPVIRLLEREPETTSQLASHYLSALGFTVSNAQSNVRQISPGWEALGEALERSLQAELLRIGSNEPTLAAPHLLFGNEIGDTRVIEVLVRLKDKRYLAYRGEMALPAFSPLRLSLLIDAGVRLLAIVLIALALTRWLVSPLNRLAAQADALGRDLHSAPVSEDGPREVQRTAQAFNNMQTRLRNYVDERTRMLTAISHDLRTPITRVLLRLEMMPASEVRDRSIADLTQLTEMVNETLDFVRGEHRLAPAEPVDLGNVLSETVSSAHSNSVGLTQRDEAALVLGRRTSLLRLFGNVVENALRYAGNAHVDVSVDTSTVVVTVDDNGSGIPENELNRVFEPFYRVEKSRNAGSGGTGLGLSIARDIARAHGGDIRLSNRTQGGLRVTVTLPLAGAKTTSPE